MGCSPCQRNRPKQHVSRKIARLVWHGAGIDAKGSMIDVKNAGVGGLAWDGVYCQRILFAGFVLVGRFSLSMQTWRVPTPNLGAPFKLGA